MARVLAKTDRPDPVAAGNNLTYAITVHNSGPSDAQGVSLSDAIPASTTFVSAMQTSGPAFSLSTPPVGRPAASTWTRVMPLVPRRTLSYVFSTPDWPTWSPGTRPWYRASLSCSSVTSRT